MNAKSDGRAEAARLSAAIDNLRVAIILLVLAIHSVLAYLKFLPPAPYAFDKPPFLWRSVPIIDHQRFIAFDLFSAWIDIFVMTLFFLLSGLFVWSGLRREGVQAFLGRRVVRLGVPFALVVGLLMPLAHYPTYLQTAAHPGIADFWHRWLGLPFWPAGPMWFLWLLLLADMTAAGLFLMPERLRRAVPRLSAYAEAHAARFLAGLLIASAVAYIPLALLFGPMQWFHRGPFSFQLSRPGLDAVWFFAGVVIGAGGIGRSMIAHGAIFARRWVSWLIAAVLLFAVWIAASAKIFANPRGVPLPWQIGDDLAFVLACFGGACCALALATRFAGIRSPMLESLRRNAYGIYLLHYVFIAWLQFALLSAEWPAAAKAALVFAGTLGLSWGITAALQRVPAVGAIIGGGGHVPSGRSIKTVATRESESPGLV